jgi:hypothetical protein
MSVGVLADAPALPLHEAGKYVAAAYIVLLALVLVYVAIMAIRLSHLERDLGELLAHEQAPAGDGARERASAGGEARDAQASQSDEARGGQSPESTLV